MLTHEQIRSAREDLQGLGNQVESWRDGHDAVRRCWELEDKIVAILPLLRGTADYLANLKIDQSLLGLMEISDVFGLFDICINFFLVQRDIHQRIDDLSSSQLDIEGSDIVLAKLRELERLLVPVSDTMKRSAATVPRLSSLSLDPGLTILDVLTSKTEERPPDNADAGRRPGAFFMTEEISAPFDLPRSGPRTIITTVRGTGRLPEPHDV